MRILIVTGHRSLVGGVEKYLQAVIPGLCRRGHEIGILYEHPGNPGSETIDLGAESLASWCLAQAEAKEILDSVAKWRPDLLYVQGFDRKESVEMERALLQAYPAVLYLHNYDRTCATGRKCFSFPRTESCTRRLGPACLILHYPRRCGGLRPDVMWSRFQQHMALNALLPRYRAILVASSYMYREVERHLDSSQRLRRVRLPVTDAGSRPPNEPAEKSLTGRILMIGRLTDVKGGDYLIRAIPRASAKLGRTLRLTVVGDGPERGRLAALAARIGVEVEFAGWVRTEEKHDLLRLADLLAVPSLWPEPFGLVGVEAGCLGIPSVAFRVGGIPDWLIAGETGELAPGDPPTVGGLSDAIVRALESPQHYRELALEAWKLSQEFTLQAHLDQLVPILENACKHTGQPAAASPAAVCLGSETP